jgi:hypothetical protein
MISVTEKKDSISIHCYEWGSFVGNKLRNSWIWLTLDQLTRELGGIFLDLELKLVFLN